MSAAITAVRAQLLYMFCNADASPHVVDHLSDALTELQVFDDLTDGVLLPIRPSQDLGEELQALPVLRQRLQEAIAAAGASGDMLALGRAGRSLAMAEQDLNGRPCSGLRATRDDLAAAAELRR